MNYEGCEDKAVLVNGLVMLCHIELLTRKKSYNDKGELLTLKVTEAVFRVK